MTVLGADPDQLVALARTVAGEAGRIRRASGDVDALIRSTWWLGRNADRFRSEWISRRSRLGTVAQQLDACSKQLQRQAADQVRASDPSSSGSTAAMPQPSWFDRAVRGVDGFLTVDEVVEALFKIGGWGLLGAYGIPVDRYLRGGSFVMEHFRWATGSPAVLRELLGSPKGLTAALKAGTSIGPLDLLGSLIDARQQWIEDASGGYEQGERAARAAGAYGASLFAPVAAGALAAGAVSATVVGAPFAPAVGVAVGLAVSLGLDDEVTDFGAGAASLLWNTGSTAVDFGSDVLDAGGDLLDGATGALGDVGGGVADFVGGLL
jgi:hypothetical protein